ncbi:Cof-type HAD-IIB family hydrolase [Lysinibacillus piscis]|uniref:Haloacid dehalogenase n=1 Tax=Lysinibacillus piscis TaxID=2518931 RepID=A0ABQ5NQ61_9BACI|nr:Cof-type HAD-IIB family hydrolase [Lysinibacillus sp. KH24]GLC90489.1 haloacid dehalogenase [Lysinibacillus sp. KH24]
MTIKAIVLDIDGTLLNDQKVISDKTKQALMTAQQKGIKVILASGRPTTGMHKLVKELEMDKYEGLIVSFNGACVTDCRTNEILFNQTIAIEDAKKVLEHIKQFKVKPMIDKDDYLYVNNVYDHILHLPTGDFNIIEYEARGGNFKLCEIDDLAAFVDFPLHKILIAGEPPYLQEVAEAMNEPFKDTLSGMFTAAVYFEFTDKGIDKAKALDSVLPSLGITAAEIISFGDGHNDRSIIEYAGIGVAMGNAVEELKALANEITLSNNEDGIAIALEKYLL